MDAIRLLMVEDSAADVELVCAHLKHAGLQLQATVVDNEQDLRSALSGVAPDIILSDFTLPRFDGMSAFDLALEVHPEVPFIFHSATIGPERAQNVLTRGAAEYVPKGQYRQLALAVERALHRSQLRQSRSDKELTGLPDRALFCEHVGAALPALHEEGLSLVMFVFDLEHLTTINSSYGRATGDELLREVAKRMGNILGSPHSMAHLGGGSFAVVYTDGVNAQDASYILRIEMSRLFDEPFEANGHGIRVSARSGIASYPADGTDAEVLLLKAEAALRKAKEAGEKYLHYQLQMDAQARERMTLEHRLEHALAENQFVLHYQPTLSLHTGRIEGAEALLRWRDPEADELQSPAKFIPVLESSGLVVDVGRWVLKETAAQTHALRSAGKPLRIAVNVSPVQLKQEEFVSELLSIVGTNAQRPVDLDIEITESMLTGDIASIMDTLQRLRTAGARIALDDFGTGYSSFSRLTKLPIDTLKIDRSFVSEMVRSPQSRALVATIISLAQACNMRSIAEGVETREQLELLHQMGCDSAQGYLIGEPMTAEALDALVNEHTVWIDDTVRESIRPQEHIHQKLERLTQQLDLACHAAGIGTWEWDLTTDTSSWDEQAAAIHDCELATAAKSYDALLACVHPDDLPRLINARMIAVHMSDRFDLEYRILNAEGRECRLRSLGVVLRDTDGQAVRMVGIVTRLPPETPAAPPL